MESFLTHLFQSTSLYDIIVFISAGFVFTGTLNYVTEAERKSPSMQSIVIDLIIGFILKNICALIPLRTPIRNLNILIFIGICIFGGFFIGKIYCSNVYNQFLGIIRVRTAPHKQIWSTITYGEESLWVRIGYKKLDIKYYGIVQYIEESERYPQIALYGYTKGSYTQNLYDEFTEDYTDDMTKFVLLDTSKADYIEFVSTNQIRAEEEQIAKEREKLEKQTRKNEKKGEKKHRKDKKEEMKS